MVVFVSSLTMWEQKTSFFSERTRQSIWSSCQRLSPSNCEKECVQEGAKCVLLSSVDTVYSVILHSWYSGPSWKWLTHCQKGASGACSGRITQSPGRLSFSFVPLSLWAQSSEIHPLTPHLFDHLRAAPLPLGIFPINIFLLYLFLCFSCNLQLFYVWLCVWFKFWTRWELSWRQWWPCNCNV